MDISVFKAVCRELAVLLPGSRIMDMAEDPAGEVCITLKGPGGKLELLICPRPDMPRIHLATGRPCRSKSLTPSVQAIMNRIAGSTIVSVIQSGLERVVSFELETKQRGREADNEKSTLIYEMTGKKPNLIVLDDSGRVAVAQTYVPISDDALRPLLPGLNYEPPPLPDKLDPFKLTDDDISAALAKGPGATPDKALFGAIGGISPLIAREIAARAGTGAGPDDLRDALDTLLGLVMSGPDSPMIIETPKGPVLAAFGLRQYEGIPSDSFAGMSEAAEAYYALVANRRLFAETKRGLLREVNRKLEAARRKLSALSKDMARSENAESYTHYGNLLMAQLYMVKEGADEVTLPDLFSEDERKITIPLEPGLSAVKNAERYFNLARKATSGARLVSKRLDAAGNETGELERLADAITSAGSLDELEPFIGKTSAGGKKRGRPGKSAGALPSFPSFRSSDGYDVLYGKNSKMNDVLTFKLAEPMDLWLHAQGYHGSHVIVRNPERRPDIPLSTILEAAAVAAYYSEARKDSSVAVDYTFRKYVRKPRDPVSGQAIFTQNKTVFVEPKKPASPAG